MAAAKKLRFFAFPFIHDLHLPLQILFIDCSKIVQIWLMTGVVPKRNIHDKFVSSAKLVRQKKSIRWAKYMYFCNWDMCWSNFCVFYLVTKNVKYRSKIALFSNEPHFNIWFLKMKKLHFVLAELSSGRDL